MSKRDQAIRQLQSAALSAKSAYEKAEAKAPSSGNGQAARLAADLMQHVRDLLEEVLEFEDPQGLNENKIQESAKGKLWRPLQVGEKSSRLS